MRYWNSWRAAEHVIMPVSKIEKKRARKGKKKYVIGTIALRNTTASMNGERKKKYS